MRQFSSLLASVLLALALFPTAAIAYVTPDQVLFDPSFRIPEAYVPARHRQIRSIVENQNARNKERRESEQAQIFGAQRVIQNAEAERLGKLQGTPDTEEELADEEQVYMVDYDDPFIRREERRLERIALRQSILNSVWFQGSSEPSAPLTNTGPGLVLALVAVATAACWTLVHARGTAVR